MLRRGIYIAFTFVFAAAAISALSRHYDVLSLWWGRMRFPPGSVPANDAQGREILRQMDAERFREVSGAYDRVRSELAAAPGAGSRRKKESGVESLEADLSTAMEWAKAGRYREAMILINSVEVRVPRSGEAAAR